MPLISQASIQELTDRLDAVTIVSDYVRLEKKSGRYWACCPFHQEKTASFTVNPDMKTYYCFGCHKGGSIINFVMEMDKASFPEAIELLAKKTGIELVYENNGEGGYSAEDDTKKKAKEELLDLYRRICATFHHFLLKTPEAKEVMGYINSRGISIEMIENFRLGYSPADRFWLYKFLSQKNYSQDFLSASGLFSSRYPRVSLFSGRLMFPISDRQGRIVAFGGRHIEVKTDEKSGATAPKYINSPELGIYRKGETLYALDLAVPEIRRTKIAYLVEGYMDTIAMHQAGILNTVAPLGTSFTDDQAKLLKRWAEKVILFMDTDEAGQASTVKSIFTCRKNGLACAVVMPKEAAPPKDPADILLHQGTEALQKKAKCFISDFNYLTSRALSLYGRLGDESSAEVPSLPGGIPDSSRDSFQGRARALAFLFPYFDLMDSEVSRNDCIEAAADSLGLLPAHVTEDYRRYKQGHRDGKKEEANKLKSEDKPGSPIRANQELTLLLALALDFVSGRKDILFNKFRANLEINEINDPYARELFISMEECLRYEESSMAELLARIGSPELSEYVIEHSESGEFSINADKFIADGIRNMKVKRLERRQDELIIKLRSIKKTNESSMDARELLAEKIVIDSELHQLKQGREA